jgi:CRISPR-associated endonuclease Cas2
VDFLYNEGMSNKRKIYYKGMQVNALGLPILQDIRKEQNKSSHTKRLYNVSFISSLKKDAPKDLIIMYDIPHELKKERDWFRRHLIKFGYIMIQKSVWVGPSPLPKDFIRYLKEINIGDKLKTLKIARPYNSSISAMA